jgi:Ser/Thr protein kinase RdoA (MazF antagonist)
MNHKNAKIQIDRIKKIVSKSYDIAEKFECSFIRRSFNDHYLIKTEHEKYVLRVYLNDKYYIDSIADIHFELEFLNFLKSRNVSVAVPITNLEGGLVTQISSSTETRMMALFSYADGQPLNYILDANIAKKFGEQIAKLHIESNHFKCDQNRYNIDTSYLIDEPIEMLKSLSKEYSIENCDFFDSYAKDLERSLNEIPMNNSTFGLIHADLNPSNVHVDEDGEITIFDFDHCATGLRIHDLAVIKLCFDKNTYNILLNSYKSSKDLSALEEKHIEAYSKALMLRKNKDVLSMQRILDPETIKGFNEKEYVIRAIELLHDLMI